MGKAFSRHTYTQHTPQSTEIKITKAVLLTVLINKGIAMDEHMALGHTQLTASSRVVSTMGGRSHRLVFLGSPGVDEVDTLRQLLPRAYWRQLPIASDDVLKQGWIDSMAKESEIEVLKF